MPFQIKICGVMTPEDAMIVADAGADAIGLNFYEKSKRCVDVETAIRIVKQLPNGVKRVGVFVNASSAAIRAITKAVQLDLVQLHGDEPPAFLAELNGMPIIRAFRYEHDLVPVRDYLAGCVVSPSAVLIDAFAPDAYGGTGRTIHWPDLKKASDFVGDLPLILAGGLTPSNVAEAIRQADPTGVDTASGVEIRPHLRKSSDLCQAFVQSAKSAFVSNDSETP